jgi:light-regulated signal transduction histidine kinase (bacteriophytochrome)
LICYLPNELENDQEDPSVSLGETTLDLIADTSSSVPTEDEMVKSTQTTSKPLRILHSARKWTGRTAALEIANVISQIQRQLAAASSLEEGLEVLVGVVRELMDSHRDQAWNGRVVTELVDSQAIKDLYKGLHFPASDIPEQGRDLYRVNKVRILYDREQQTARLVYRKVEDLTNPLDLTHSYLRAMSPTHIKYLENMAVRSSNVIDGVTQQIG